jgi:GNAT superfamily N-acetyltransferase
MDKQSSRKITYQEELYDAVVDEIQPLIHAHWEEIASAKDKIKLNPDYSMYKSLNDARVLRIFTVRNEGKLIGYFIVICNPHMHYSDHVYAMNDIIYIDPEYRGSTIAFKLLRSVEKRLKQDGVSVLMINMKVHAPFDRLLEKLEFKNTERVYTKYIGD